MQETYCPHCTTIRAMTGGSWRGERGTLSWLGEEGGGYPVLGGRQGQELGGGGRGTLSWPAGGEGGKGGVHLSWPRGRSGGMDLLLWPGVPHREYRATMEEEIIT